ncbi:GatB/YqeY domain-containing protein, partial [Streptomyces sp. BE20]|uniref:GatB/YqeY domain-containing protein n=1 Tax=Streptomyces sp. BE20 TaxID=3002525 RepID=UPI002E79806F
AEVLKEIGREAKKRREAAEAFDTAGRTEQTTRERAEVEVLADYLPKQISDDELPPIVTAALAHRRPTWPKRICAVKNIFKQNLDRLRGGPADLSSAGQRGLHRGGDPAALGQTV